MRSDGQSPPATTGKAKDPDLDVSIVLPCLNESSTIAQCVAVAREALSILEKEQDLSGEVIVADNGSDDGSQRLARDAGARVIDIDERGYGAALRGGFAAARGRYFVMGDSDMSYDFREAVPMIAALADGADVCMGNRFKGEIKPGAMPWKNRYIGNPVLSTVLKVFFRTPIGDSHCGLRALTRDAYFRLKLTSEGMEFASEMVLKAALLDLKIAERPITLSPDGRGRAPHLNPWRDGFRHLFYMFLLSPTWLFLIPTVLLGLVGLTIFVALLANPNAEIVRVGNFGLGDHWAVVASSFVIIAAQTLIAGLAVMMIGFREGYMVPGRVARWVVQRSELRRWLISSILCFLAGLIWAAIIAGGWAQSGFGDLNEMRNLIAAFTLMVVGVQICFGGFLLSVAAGNKLKHNAAL